LPVVVRDILEPPKHGSLRVGTKEHPPPRRCGAGGWGLLPSDISKGEVAIVTDNHMVK
jgi:hypothetical protein